MFVLSMLIIKIIVPTHVGETVSDSPLVLEVLPRKDLKTTKGSRPDGGHCWRRAP